MKARSIGKKCTIKLDSMQKLWWKNGKILVWQTNLFYFEIGIITHDQFDPCIKLETKHLLKNKLI